MGRSKKSRGVQERRRGTEKVWETESGSEEGGNNGKERKERVRKEWKCTRSGVYGGKSRWWCRDGGRVYSG